MYQDDTVLTLLARIAISLERIAAALEDGNITVTVEMTEETSPAKDFDLLRGMEGV